MVIFDPISNSSNVYPQFESILEGHLSWPSVSKSRIAPKKSLIGSQPHSHEPLAPILVFLSQIDRLWNKILRRLCSFPPSVTYKENWLYKTSYNSYTVQDKKKRNSARERMLVYSTGCST
jgi:hypothetical protein